MVLEKKWVLSTFCKWPICMNLYLPNDAFLELEDKREVVENWILFKMSFCWVNGWSMWKLCLVKVQLTSPKETLIWQILTFDDLRDFLGKSWSNLDKMLDITSKCWCWPKNIEVWLYVDHSWLFERTYNAWACIF